MPEAWRIVKEKHAAAAFSGEGAARTAGRWNSRGVRVVYTSSTKSLAALEILVHLNPAGAFQICRHSRQIRRANHGDIRSQNLASRLAGLNRRRRPPSKLAMSGCGQARSAVLALPSVIIPGESNYLLNPAHPDFKKISIGRKEKFTFDSRLLL